MADERGSVVSVTDSAGATVALNAYDEYGIPAPGNAGRFGYTGQAWLSETGMWHYKARMYSPTLGRFMQTDPIGYADGMNWYNYVGGDPVNRVDRSGTESCVLGGETWVPKPGVSTETFMAACTKAGGDWAAMTVVATRKVSEGLGGAGRQRGGSVSSGGGNGSNSSQSQNRACNPGVADVFFENALGVAGVIGDGLAIAGVLTGNPVVAVVGLGLSYGSTALSGALNYSQGDYAGLTGDIVGAGAGLLPGGRLARRAGGAAFDPGRNAAGRLVSNWRGRQAAQDIATEGVQERTVGSATSAVGSLFQCPR